MQGHVDPLQNIFPVKKISISLAQYLLIRSASMLDVDLKRIEDLVSLQQTVVACYSGFHHSR